MNLKWIEARVSYTAIEGLLCAELIADLFYEMGLHGVLLDEAGQPAGQRGISEDRPVTGSCAVIGYIPVTAGSHPRCEELKRRLRQLKFPTRLTMQEIDDRDWAQYWKSHFKPLTVCPGLTITPSWEKKPAERGETVIEIDPGMAFGTGHHPTTVLCLQLIRKHLQTGDSLLDIGTGTGILAISAVKLGGGAIVAVDSDQTAIMVAKENRRRNRIGPDRLHLLCGRLAAPVRGSFNVVVANILPHVILELIEHLERVITPEGMFIASGIPDEKIDDVIRKLEKVGVATVAVSSLDGWSALAGRFPK